MKMATYSREASGRRPWATQDYNLVGHEARLRRVDLASCKIGCPYLWIYLLCPPWRQVSVTSWSLFWFPGCIYRLWNSVYRIGVSRAISHANDTEQQPQVAANPRRGGFSTETPSGARTPTWNSSPAERKTRTRNRGAERKSFNTAKGIVVNHKHVSIPGNAWTISMVLFIVNCGLKVGNSFLHIFSRFLSFTEIDFLCLYFFSFTCAWDNRSTRSRVR